MDHSAHPNLVHLNPAVREQRTLRIPRPDGYRVVALTGEVWITQYRRREDIVLRPGEAVGLEGKGLALVTAFESADVEVIPPFTAAPARAPRLSSVDLACYERKARRLRAEAIGSAFARAWRTLRRLATGGGRVAATARHAG